LSGNVPRAATQQANISTTVLLFGAGFAALLAAFWRLFTSGQEPEMGRSINLEGKVAMITGASSGLGKRFAQVLSQAGAKVVLASRRVERLKELRAEIEASGGAAHVVSLDVTDYQSIRSAVAHAETEAGTIDILVNNSGVSTTQKLADVTPADFEYVFDTNTRGAFFVAQEVAKRMIMRGNVGGPKPAYRIINIASVAGLRVLPQIGLYAISKAAVVHMTKAMALEWGRHGINVNAICPGYIDTEINHHHWSTEQGQKLISMLPRHRVGKPEDLDGLLLLLAADESSFMNGAIISADDGFGLT
jgi:NAD(P)-dependent dehydrogenase (short-subunit alcohol dehydrogenase family)